MRSIIREIFESGRFEWQVVVLLVRSRRGFGAALVAGLCIPALAGCGEEEAPARRPAATSVTAPEATPDVLRAPRGRAWLELSDSTPPEVFLAAHSAPPGDAARLGVLLKQADGLFDETPRMLANRTAQLQEMLAASGIRESADVLLEGFMDLGRPGGRAGYGDLCQHYYNLRVAGVDRAAALKALAAGAPGRRTP